MPTMKSNKHFITIESLPREIIIQILSKLPTQSLLNIKLVCHSWNNLSQDPLLIKLHFTRHQTSSLLLHNDHPIKNKFHALYLYPHGNKLGIVNEIPVPNLPEFDFVGSSNGLLCLCDSLHKTSFYIYNPFSGDLTTLPELATPADVWTVFGFGFNKSTKEYKVLKFSTVQRNGRHNRIRTRSDVLIITVGGHEWRSLGHTPYYPISESPSQVVVNGKLHWSDWPSRYGPSRVLVSFDLENEKFEQVPKPEEGWGRGGYSLLVLRGCLSAAVYGNNMSFEVWTMKEYGVKESWVKAFVVGSYLPKQVEERVDPSFKVSKFYKRPFTRILCGLRSGEILLVYKCRAMVCYDPVNGVFKDINIPGMPVWFEACCSLLCC